MRNLEFCDRCLPEKCVPAMGYIPLPEMTNIGDTRVNERRILCCNFHYFEAKKNCFWVIPFNKDDDPVDSFLTRVKQKHKRLRQTPRLKFKPPRYEEEETLDPVILEDFPKPRRITTREGIPKRTGFRKDFEPTAEKPKLLSPRNGSSKRPKLKVHLRAALDEPGLDNGKVACGYPVASTQSTTDVELLTCKFCIDIANSFKQVAQV